MSLVGVYPIRGIVCSAGLICSQSSVPWTPLLVSVRVLPTRALCGASLRSPPRTELQTFIRECSTYVPLWVVLLVAYTSFWQHTSGTLIRVCSARDNKPVYSPRRWHL